MNDDERTAVTIGIFDGVHRGHRQLLERTEEIAQQSGKTSIAYTFSGLPIEKKSPFAAGLLLPLEQRKQLLGRYVDQVHVEDFSRIEDLTPSQFVKEIILGQLSASAVIVGSDWKFGRNREGDISRLKELAGDRFRVEVLKQLRIDGKPISSSWIREELQQGQVESATRLLGRPPSIHGEVVRGSQIGRELGYPTANISVDPEILIPRKGVYAVLAEVEGERVRGLLYIGHRPSLGENGLRIETHLLKDYSSELYGQEMTLHLLEFLREEQEFDSKAQLQEAINNDIENAREVFKSRRAEGLETHQAKCSNNETTGEDQYV